MSAAYLQEQEHTIRGCSKYAKEGGSPGRYGPVASFLKNYKHIISIGCAGYDPIKFKATHALDVSYVALDLLRKAGWQGLFYLGDCRNLHFNDQTFEAGCLVDVVEHLETCNDIILAVKELNRVCRNWILTTPLDGMNIKSHKRHLEDRDLDFFCRKTGAKWKKSDRWYFMWKGEHGPGF